RRLARRARRDRAAGLGRLVRDLPPSPRRRARSRARARGGGPRPEPEPETDDEDGALCLHALPRRRLQPRRSRRPRVGKSQLRRRACGPCRHRRHGPRAGGQEAERQGAQTMKIAIARIGVAGVAALLVACGSKAPAGITPKKMADAVYAVVAADRTVYTREVVNRLQEAKVIRASEHFTDDKTLPLPAQMLRMAAESVQKGDKGFTYALLSQWPVNKQNAPKTSVEIAGLKEVASSGGSYYADETLGGKKYFTAVYADKAVAQACVDCHNDNKDSPRTDFKIGDVMGGVVIRIPTE